MALVNWLNRAILWPLWVISSIFSIKISNFADLIPRCLNSSIKLGCMQTWRNFKSAVKTFNLTVFPLEARIPFFADSKIVL